jgi:hypothetical protein
MLGKSMIDDVVVHVSVAAVHFCLDEEEEQYWYVVMVMMLMLIFDRGGTNGGERRPLVGE